MEAAILAAASTLILRFFWGRRRYVAQIQGLQKQPNSRLSCQIKVSDELDGLVVRMPESQH